MVKDKVIRVRLINEHLKLEKFCERELALAVCGVEYAQQEVRKFCFVSAYIRNSVLANNCSFLGRRQK